MRKVLLILCLAVAVRAAGVKVLTTDTLWDWRTVAGPVIGRASCRERVCLGV